MISQCNSWILISHHNPRGPVDTRVLQWKQKNLQQQRATAAEWDEEEQREHLRQKRIFNQSNRTRSRPDWCSTANESPSGANESPSGVNESPSGVNESPSGVNESPSGVNESPSGARTPESRLNELLRGGSCAQERRGDGQTDGVDTACCALLAHVAVATS
ncbi:hypothetical protein EYF80_033266 [Liparis tanakae]|uniref:Uncharacterized protein n=1 Tax=Liparis tanakae TaxID=230148 RepID=A0A4Z2GTG1_9TELE|nr:hypothetical protein EYF80_033266 [Liparis tanakae]